MCLVLNLAHLPLRLCRNGFVLTDNRELLLRALNILAGRLSATGACSQVAFNSIVRYCSLCLLILIHL